MKALSMLLVCFVFFGASLSAAVFHSTTEGGGWDAGETWQGSTIPGPDDDVYIHGRVYVSNNSCHNLYVVGSEALIQNYILSNCSITVYGNLNTTGWVANNASGTLTVNLYGNLNIGYNFIPQTFNWLGSGDKLLSCPSPWSVRTIGATTISSTNTIYAASDLCFIPGTTAPQLITGNGSQVTINLFNPDTRTTYNLESRSCKLDYLKIVGDGNSQFNFNNDSSLSGVFLQNCSMENLISTGTFRLGSDNTFTNITNNGSIYNIEGYYSVGLYGNFINNGSFQRFSGGYGLNATSYGNVSNYGIFKPSNWTIGGSGDILLANNADSPFSCWTAISVGPDVEDIYAGSNLYFDSVGSLSLPSLKVFDSTRTARSLYLSNCNVQPSSFIGISGSIISGTNANFLASEFTNLRLEGTLLIRSASTITNCENYATLLNDNGYYSSISVFGDFSNFGTVQRHSVGYGFTVNAYDSVLNYGIWSMAKLILYGDDVQNISFPNGHAFTGNEISDATPTVGIYAISDLYFQDATINLGNSTLYLTPGNYSMYLSGTLFKSTNLASNPESGLTMESNSRLENVSIASLNIHGTFLFQSHCYVSGDLVNYGTIRDYTSGYNLNVAGNLTNNGTITNVSYYFTINVSGNVINNGVWNNYKLNLGGSSTQTISFPLEYPFTGANFSDSNADSAISTNGDLYFSGTTIDTNNASWQLSSGGWDLNLQNCILVDAVVVSNENNVLNMTDGGYINNCSFGALTTSGLINVYSNTTIDGNLVNLGTIQNYGSNIHLYVQGNLTNQNTVCNNNYNLYMDVYHNVLNSGTISCYSLYFAGAADQHLNNSGTISVSTIVDSNSASAIVCDTNLSLTNTNVDLNNANLILNSAIRDGKTLSLTGGYLTEAFIIGGNGSKLVLANNAYLSNVTIDDIIFEGTVLVGDNVAVTNLTNNAIISNWPYGGLTLSINGRLDNNGSITNNTYSLTINIYGDLYDYGVLSNSTVDFKSSSDQHLYQSATADTIRCGLLKKTVATGNVIMLSNLNLKGCNINFGGRSLVMQSGRTSHNLSMVGGYIQNTHLDSDNYSILKMNGSAYLADAITSDNLTTEGTVQLTGNFYVDNLKNYGTIQNFAGYNAHLFVNDRLDNYGTLLKTGYAFYVSLYGDFYDYGYVMCSTIYWRGSENQNIYQDPAADAIRAPAFVKLNSEGELTMLSDLRLVSCYISMNNKTLNMQSGLTGYNLTMQGGYIQSTYLNSDFYSILNMSEGAYLADGITSENLTLEGTVQLNGYFYVDNLVNNATIQNLAGYNANLYVYERLDNHGTLLKTGYGFYLSLYGDFYDYGYVMCSTIYWRGSENQNIYQAPTADAIRVPSFGKTNSAGDLTMLSDLSLVNCYISLNNRNLILQSGGIDRTLTMDAGYITATYLAAPGTSTLNCCNGTYLNAINGGNFIFQGTINILGICNFGSITNHAYTRNLPNWSAMLYVNGDLINHATFYSDSYPLSLYISGNLVNNGTMSNRRIYLNGTNNQIVELNGTETIDYLTVNSNIGTSQWHHDGIFMNITATNLDLAMTSPYLNGYWQPYNATTGIWGRLITFSPPATLDAPDNVQLTQASGTISLQWNQVTGATYYKVFYSDNPDTGFSVLNDFVTDDNPGDGIVQFITPGADSKRFYKVTAHN